VVFGWVPLEEYTFFVLETVLSGLFWLALVRRLPSPLGFRADKRLARAAGLGLGAAWLLSAGLFFSGWPPAAYLSITLFWALPAILPQLLFGADLLWHYRRLVFWAVFVPGLYLSLSDIVALRAGTWAISPAHTSGLLFFGILPVEEVVFFFITNMLIAFGLTLMLSNLSEQRMDEWRARNFKGLP
jgi:putative membrane protein